MKVNVERRIVVFLVSMRGREHRDRQSRYSYGWKDGLRLGRRMGFREADEILVHRWLRRRLRLEGWLLVDAIEQSTSETSPRAWDTGGLEFRFDLRVISLQAAAKLGVDDDRRRLRIPRAIQAIEIDERLEGKGMSEWTYRNLSGPTLEIRKLRKPGLEAPRSNPETYAVSGEIPGATGKLFGKEKLR